MTTQSLSPPDFEVVDKGGEDFYNAEVTGELDLERPDRKAPATWYRQATPGTTYVRCLLPARHIGGQSIPVEREDLMWNTKTDEFIMRRHQGDAAVWQFLGDEIRTKFAWGLQDKGIRTLMDTDDNYLVPHPLAQGMQVAWHRTEEEARGGTGYSNEMHRKIVPTFDGIICSTEFLSKEYREFTDADKVYTCPNTVDPDDWVDLAPKPTDVLRIVYSGSQSHLRDAPHVTKALKWAARQTGVEVWCQGIRPPWGFYQHVPWSNRLHGYRHKMGAFHVGVAPLVPGRWSNGKSDLKALEYAMAGVMPLLARTEPYRDWEDDFLVDPTPAAWTAKIKWLIRNQDVIPILAKYAKDYVLEHRTTAGNIWRWEEALRVTRSP